MSRRGMQMGRWEDGRGEHYMGAVIRCKILTTSFRCDGTAKAKANDSQQRRRQQAASKQNVYASQHKLNKSSSCRCGLAEEGVIGGKETGRIWKGYVHNCCAKLCKKKGELRSTQWKHLRRAEYLSLSLSISVQFLSAQNTSII